MRLLTALTVILGVLLLPISNLEADTFPVTKTADTNDGTCDPDCSLREAIRAANANVGADDVPVPAGTYLLTLGSLIVLDDLDIAGTGQASTIIDGNASFGVFAIQSSVVAEGFFATLECELLDRRPLATSSETRRVVFAWIEGWYNSLRRHSALGYLSPNAFERRHVDGERGGFAPHPRS